jgi:hypothetical protein
MLGIASTRKSVRENGGGKKCQASDRVATTGFPVRPHLSSPAMSNAHNRSVLSQDRRTVAETLEGQRNTRTEGKAGDRRVGRL